MANAQNYSRDSLPHIQNKRKESGAIGTIVWWVSVSLRQIETGNVPRMNIPHKEIWVYWVTDPAEYYPLTRRDVEQLLQIAYNAKNNLALDPRVCSRAINSSQLRLEQWMPGKTYFNPVEWPVTKKQAELGSVYIEGRSLRLSNFDTDGKPLSSVVDKICGILEIH